MSKRNDLTEAVISDLLERLSEISLEASEVAEQISKSFGIDIQRPAQMASEAASCARRVVDLSARLATVSRQKEDVEALRIQLLSELS